LAVSKSDLLKNATVVAISNRAIGNRGYSFQPGFSDDGLLPDVGLHQGGDVPGPDLHQMSFGSVFEHKGERDLVGFSEPLPRFTAVGR